MLFIAQISMRMDDNLKKEAEQLFDELGLTMSSAFTIFCKTKLARKWNSFWNIFI